MPKPNVNPEVSKAAAEMGRAGGRNGTGTSKDRGPMHYRRMAAIRQQNKLKRLYESQ